MHQVIQIAIDGPASSGKSTIAKRLASRLDINYLDTGAMYRAVTLDYLNNPYDLEDEQSVLSRVRSLRIQVIYTKGDLQVRLNGEDVTEAIRSSNVSQNVSKIAAHPMIRQELVYQQQKIAQQQSVVMDGRDITTVVLPNAQYKFFVTADAATRAQRRYEENQRKGYSNQSLEAIKEEIERRDYYDSTRDVTPLRQAEDAMLIDTSHLTIDEVLEKILHQIQK